MPLLSGLNTLGSLTELESKGTTLMVVVLVSALPQAVSAATKYTV